MGSPEVANGLLPILGSTEALKTCALFANAILATAGLGMMWHGGEARSKVQIDFGAKILGALLLTRFVDVVGSMQRQGATFLVAGLVMAFLAYMLNEKRKRMVEKTRGYQ